MLESLKKQILQPDVIYVNISKESYMLDTGIQEIPQWLENNEKVQINYVQNRGSYRKLLHLFEKDFVVFGNHDRGLDGFTSLLSLLGLEDRLLFGVEDIQNKKIDDIDYNAVNKILDENRKSSLEFLTGSLKK